jgi:hypothetical protein
MRRLVAYMRRNPARRPERLLGRERASTTDSPRSDLDQKEESDSAAQGHA